MTTTEQTKLHSAVDGIMREGTFGMQIANRWNGTDLHNADGETLRITREDPEGDYWIGTLSYNGIVGKYATVSSDISEDSLATIAWELWEDR